MQKLQIEKTKTSPEIHFDEQTHIHSIKGESYPENTTTFYTPVLEWLTKYLSKDNKDNIVFNMELIYFNSSSSKLFMDIFKMLEKTKNDKIGVNWIYDKNDEVMKEYGEGFQETIEHISFNLASK